MGFVHTPVKLILSERSLFVVSAFARRLCCCDPPWSGAENVIAKNGYSSGAVNYNVNDVNKTNQDYPTAIVPARYPKKEIRLVLYLI